MKYEMLFDVPFTLDAYDQVTLKEHLEGEIRSWLRCREAEVVYLAKEE